MVADPSSCQSFSPPLESAEQADKNGEMEKNTKANVNGVADTGKLEQQRVYEFVDQVTERLKIQAGTFAIGRSHQAYYNIFTSSDTGGQQRDRTNVVAINKS
jgi:hypothetical protein